MMKIAQKLLTYLPQLELCYFLCFVAPPPPPRLDEILYDDENASVDFVLE